MPRRPRASRRTPVPAVPAVSGPEISVGTDAAFADPGPGVADAGRSARHLRDPALLPDQRRRRSTSSARRRSTCSAWTGGSATSTYVTYYDAWDGAHPRVYHAEGQAVRRVRERRGDQQLAAQERRDPRPHAPDVPGGPRPKVAMVFFNAGDRADLRRARLRPDPAVGRAARAPGLQDRHHPARRRGRCAERAERPDPGRRAGPTSSRPREDAGLGTDLVLQTPYGDSGKTTFFLAARGGLGQARRRHRRPGRQDHEADHQPAGRRRGGADPARHDRRAVHERADRLRRADAVPGRLVRQRDVPRGADRRAPGQGDRPGPPARRPARAGGLPRASSRSTCWSTWTATRSTSAS